MIGSLPGSLMISGYRYAIRTDFRVILQIITALNDPDLTDRDKCYVALKCLYKEYDKIPHDKLAEAAEKAYWFIGGGDAPKSTSNVKTFDWEQDESIIFPAINKAAGYETRAVKYLHWWSFLGLFGEIDEGLFSQVLYLRGKMARGEKLDKYEKRFVRDHKDLITLKAKLSEEEQRKQNEDEAFIKSLTGGE